MNINYTIELRQRCFNLLEDIANYQMEIAKNIADGRNVHDFELYLKKQSTRLRAYSDARQTLESIIKNIDNYTDVQDKLEQIETMLKKGD